MGVGGKEVEVAIKGPLERFLSDGLGNVLHLGSGSGSVLAVILSCSFATWRKLGKWYTGSLSLLTTAHESAIISE